MGVVVKISAKDKPDTIREALTALKQGRERKKQQKVFADYYGSLPHSYGDGLTYQQKQRDEWR